MFTIDVKGSEMMSIDLLITDIDKLSWPEALQVRKLFVMIKISFLVAGARKIDCTNVPIKNALWEEVEVIPLAKLGPKLEKYSQNLFAIVRGSEISLPSILKVDTDKTLEVFLFKISLRSLEVARVLDLTSFNFFS